MYLSTNPSIYLSIYLFIYLSIYLSFSLSIYLSIYLSNYLTLYVSIHLSIYLSIHPSINPSIPSIYLSIFLSIYLAIYLSLYLRSVCLSVYLSTCLSARVKMKLFCQTSSGFGLTSYLSIYLSIYLSFSLYLSSLSLSLSLSRSSVYLTIYLCIYPSVYLSIYLSLCLSVCLSTSLSASLKTYLFCETSSSFELDNIKNAAILRDFLIFQSWQHQNNSAWLPHIFRSWQHQKRNISAWLPHIFRSWQHQKRNIFCETSWIFELDNIQNEAILRDFFNFWTWQHQKPSNSARLPKVECRADGLVPMRFAIFPLHLSKVLRLPRNIDARSYEVLHLSRKIISANLNIWCSKMQPLSGNQRPDLLTSLMNMSFVLPLPREMHLWIYSSNVPRLPSFLEMLQNPHVLLTFDKVHNRLRLPRETSSERPKVVRRWCALHILTSKCVLRHDSLHFFDIATSKSRPNLVCFVHFDFDMCFAPQRRALFRISTSKSGPDLVCFVHFDFKMCFAPQRRAIFHLSSGQMAPHPPL